MRSTVIALLVVGLLASCSDQAPAPPTGPVDKQPGNEKPDKEEDAVKLVQRMHGKIIRDGNQPDKPVTEVSFFGSRVGDMVFRVLPQLKHL